ncbi:MAG: HAD family hydrolase [Lachnospiraceae bacterium]|jgi:phosphoglycolate phosphatase|nr:HAD family hydrolase [Lachnospiraceae bacterium]
MKKKYVLFDLDGTLTDSREGIINSIEYMLRFYGISVEDRESLLPWLGPPLKDSLMKYHGFDERTALEGVEKYREYFDRQGIFENRLFPGIEDMLFCLKEKGYVLLVATSKPEVAAVRVLKHFDLEKYFDYIGGATLDDSRVKKGDVIRYVLEKCGVEDKSLATMVGDREHDIQGAKENGLKAVGVLYGYSAPGELADAAADYLVNTPKDLVKLLP